MAETENRAGQPVADDGGDEDVLVTPQGEKLDMSITGTMNLDAGASSPKTNPDRLQSMKFAVAGLLYVLKREQSIQIVSIISIVVVVLGLWVGLNTVTWALLLLALGAVWVTECLNTAIEAAINLATDEVHPLAKIGKDVASAAALLSTIVFVLIALLVLVPPVLRALSGDAA
jgi:diacylglycerol kinase